jgi:hypothetical protein
VKRRETIPRNNQFFKVEQEKNIPEWSGKEKISHHGFSLSPQPPIHFLFCGMIRIKKKRERGLVWIV